MVEEQKRRRADAHTVAETLENVPEGARTGRLGGARNSVVYECGCVAVDPAGATANVQLLECPTHAALQAKLRRRQTDR